MVFFTSSVRQVHREFLRSGADVIQAFTFSMDDDLEGEHAKYGVCNFSICFESYLTLETLTSKFKFSFVIPISF